MNGLPVCCGGGSVEVSEDEGSTEAGDFGCNGVNDCGGVLGVGRAG